MIGAKPSSGVLLGAAGNVAFYLGEPATTRISSLVMSGTFSTKKQTSLINRFTMFGAENRWRLDGDHRFQWTSLDTYGLGTSADTRAGIVAGFDFFRLHHIAYYRLGPGAVAVAGLYFDNHTDVGPREGEESAWTSSPYVEYSQAHGLPLDSQIAAGTSLDLVWDNRDSFIKAERGWLAKASYRTSFDGFLGGDSSWQNSISTCAPTCTSRATAVQARILGVCRSRRRRRGAFFDLPSTGGDTYGRSARGYAEGQFRGERLAYGEIDTGRR